MFRTVLVPVDGSDHSIKATAVASDLAAAYGARMVLMHVIADEDVPEELARFAEIENLPKRKEARIGGHFEGTAHGPLRVPDGEREGADRHAVLLHIAERVLGDAEGVARLHGVKDTVMFTEEGDPVDRILQVARREHADAIVMGSRGLSDLAGVVMGSISHKVAHRAERTCITVS